MNRWRGWCRGAEGIHVASWSALFRSTERAIGFQCPHRYLAAHCGTGQAADRSQGEGLDEGGGSAGRCIPASEIREGLGDKTPEQTKLAAAETFTAASLEAMRAYARGQGFHDAGRYLEAHRSPTRKRRPTLFWFGRAYAATGSVYGNLKRFEKAEESYKKALKLIHRMTEREKYRTLGVGPPGRIAQLSPGDSELRGTRRQIPRR